MTQLDFRPRSHYVGSAVKRFEDPKFLMGRGCYVDDRTPPGTLHVAFVRSPFAHARIVSVDTSQARSLPGVHVVFSGADIAHWPPFTTTVPENDAVLTTSRRMLPIDRARFAGEAVAVVAAESRPLAEDACELVAVDWEELPALTTVEEAMAPDAPLLHEEIGTNNYAHIVYETSGFNAAKASAAHVLTKRFHVGRCIAAPLEGRAVVAEYDPGRCELVVWNSSQTPHVLRTQLAELLGIRESRVRVVAPDVGGGFGLKCQVFVEDVIVARLAVELGRPIKWTEDRTENLIASGHAREMSSEISVAVAADGTFLAFEGHYVGDAGAYQCHPWTSLTDPLLAATFVQGVYDVAEAKYVVDNPFTNKCQSSPYRGVGYGSGQAPRELLVDEVAEVLGIDPLDLRLRNTIAEGPYLSATGFDYDVGSYREALEKAAEIVGYEAFRAAQREAWQAGHYVGIGISPHVDQSAWGKKVSSRSGYGDREYTDSTTVVIEPDGSVLVSLGLHSHGQGHETTFAQVAADVLGVRLEDVRVIEGDTATSPYGMGTYGSRSCVVGNGAVAAAAADVRAKLGHIAGDALEASPEDIVIVDGCATVRGAPSISITVKELAQRSYFGPHGLGAMDDVRLSSRRNYDCPETYSNGCIIATVEVDVETGGVRIDRLVVVEDCGPLINPLIVEGQVHGAVAQGIGMALYEEAVYSENGQPQAATLMDFLYPSATDVPRSEIFHIETPSPRTFNGSRGVAEGGTIAAPSAVLSAIQDALRPFGVRIDRMPVTPQYLRSLLRGRAAVLARIGG
jgi:carbon-monoxide dehydrogenase large subunit